MTLYGKNKCYVAIDSNKQNTSILLNNVISSIKMRLCQKPKERHGFMKFLINWS